MRPILRVLAVCIATGVLLIAATTADASRPKSPIKPGTYLAKPIPGMTPSASLRRFILSKVGGKNEKNDVVILGRTYHLQFIVLFFWVKEATVPADGIVHVCYGPYSDISPPGLPPAQVPRHGPLRPGTLAFVGAADGLSSMNPFYAATGKDATPAATGPAVIENGVATPAPGTETPRVHFNAFGVFAGLKDRRPYIRITATCGGERHTRTYTWAHA
jgi:hypothetical protein